MGTLFTDNAPIGTSPSWHPGTLIVALTDNNNTKAARNDSSATKTLRQGSERLDAQEVLENAVGILELSCEDIEACGPEGKWYPLRTKLSTTEQSHRSFGQPKNGGFKRGSIVGEVLVSFSRLQYPKATALPTRASSARRLSQTRPSRKNGRLADKRLSDRRNSEGNHLKYGRNTRNDTLDVAVAPRLPEGVGRNASSPELLVYLHVWDALMPLARPDSALYFTARVFCPGARVQRVSTKPARGRGGPSTTEITSKGRRSCRVDPRVSSSRSNAMHVLWDEHLNITVDRHAGGMLIELLLSDASIDHAKEAGTPVLAAREGESFDAFAERNQPSDSVDDLGKSSTPARALPRPTVYRLKLHRDRSDRALNPDRSDEELHHDRSEKELYPDRSNTELHPDRSHKEPCLDRPDEDKGLVEEVTERSSTLGDIEVRMASLVVPRAEDASREEEVNAFLARKADVARIPNELNRPPRVVGDTAVLTTTVPRESSWTQSRSRLLDLSAVGGLFRSFADTQKYEKDSKKSGREAGDTTSVIERLPSTTSEGNAGSIKERLPSTTSGVAGRPEQHPEFEATLSRGNLNAIAREYFPEMKELVEANGTITLQQANEDWGTTETQDGSATSLSFAEFVEWLRQIPEEALGVAGLLASPRTVLNKTEIVMDQSAERAEELSAALKLAEAPTMGLIGGWCSVALKSTGEGAALDRVRLGWGESTKETKEISWRRHLRMLRDDVMVLGNTLTQLEDRYHRRQSGSSITDRTTAAGKRDVPTPEELSRRVEPDPATPLSSIGQTNHTHVERENPAITCGNEPAAGEWEPAHSIVARYLDQKAEALGSAAAHLKEALRCAGDTLYRDVENTPGWSTKKSHSIRGSTQSPPTSGRGRGSDHLHRHNLYGTVLHHIKHVQRFQTEIAMLRRRVGALLPPPGKEGTAQLPDLRRRSRGCDGDGEFANCAHGNRGGIDREAPRSALALVKRIRRAQEAARRHSSAFTDSVDTTKTQRTPQTREQGSDCPPSSKKLNHNHSSGCINGGMPVREGDCSMPNRETIDCSCKEGGTTTESPSSPTRVSAQPSLYGLCPRHSTLRVARERLESVTAAFRENAVDLPATVVSATAEGIAEIASGCVKEDENGTSLASAWPAAVMYCPIDRQEKHEKSYFPRLLGKNCLLGGKKKHHRLPRLPTKAMSPYITYLQSRVPFPKAGWFSAGIRSGIPDFCVLKPPQRV